MPIERYNPTQTAGAAGSTLLKRGTPRQSSKVGAAAFGAYEGAQKLKAGAASATAASTLGNLSLEIQKRQNEVEAMEADNAVAATFQNVLMNEKDGLLNSRGENSRGLTDKWSEISQQIYQQTTGNASNDHVREMLSKSISRRILQTSATVGSHELRQIQESQQKAYEASVLSAQDYMGMSANDPDQYLEAEMQLEAAVIGALSFNGIAPNSEAGRYAILKAKSRGHVLAIDALMARQDYAGATQLLDANAGSILQQDEDSIRARLTVANNVTMDQQKADQIVAMHGSKADALGFVRKNYSGRERDALTSRVSAQFSMKDAANREAVSKIMNGASAKMIACAKSGDMACVTKSIADMAAVDPKASLGMSKLANDLIEQEAELYGRMNDIGVYGAFNDNAYEAEVMQVMSLSEGADEYFEFMKYQPIDRKRLDSDGYNRLKSAETKYRAAWDKQDKEAVSTMRAQYNDARSAANSIGLTQRLKGAELEVFTNKHAPLVLGKFEQSDKQAEPRPGNFALGMKMTEAQAMETTDAAGNRSTMLDNLVFGIPVNDPYSTNDVDRMRDLYDEDWGEILTTRVVPGGDAMMEKAFATAQTYQAGAMRANNRRLYDRAKSGDTQAQSRLQRLWIRDYNPRAATAAQRFTVDWERMKEDPGSIPDETIATIYTYLNSSAAQ